MPLAHIQVNVTAVSGKKRFYSLLTKGVNLIVRALSAASFILQHSARCHSLGPLRANGFCLVKSVIQCLQLARLCSPLTSGLVVIPLLCMKRETQGGWHIEFFPIPQLVKLTLHQMVGFQAAFESFKNECIKSYKEFAANLPKASSWLR